MMVLIWLSVLIGVFSAGICWGAAMADDFNGKIRLPAGWWVLPAAVMGGLLMAAFTVWVGV